MSRIVILGASAALTIGSMLLPSVASAQTQVWLSDRRYTEGAGFQVGDFELHPGIGAEFGFDSNYFQRADDPDEDPIGVLRLRITPSFSISTRTQRAAAAEGEEAELPSVNFRAGINATYDEFFPVSGSDGGQEAASEQRNISGALNFQLGILPGRPFSVNIGGGVSRSLDPSNEGDLTRSFNRVTPQGNIEAVIAPGGGMFDWRFGYGFTGTFFESSVHSDLNNLNNEISTRGRWRFLPRSALLFDGRFGFITYLDELYKVGSHPLRARLGYSGLITNSIAILAMGGWGASFYEEVGGVPPNDFDSFIGQAEFKWFITPNPQADAGGDGAGLALSTLAVGFNRDFGDAYLGSYVESNKGYAKFSYMFGGAFLLVLDASVAALNFPSIERLNQEAWTDIRLDTSAFGEYRFTDYFGLNATVRYIHNFSDVVLATDEGFEALQFQEFQAMLGARFFW